LSQQRPTLFPYTTLFRSVEANAGGASVESMAAKMGNSIDENRKLQKDYIPANAAAIRTVDEAQKKGRKILSEEQNQFKKLKLGLDRKSTRLNSSHVKISY